MFMGVEFDVAVIRPVVLKWDVEVMQTSGSSVVGQLPFCRPLMTTDWDLLQGPNKAPGVWGKPC